MKERWREIESDVGRERVVSRKRLRRGLGVRVGRKIVGEMVEKRGKIVG